MGGPSELREHAGRQEGLRQPLASPLLLPADTQSFQTQRTGYILMPPTARSARRPCLTASLSTSRTTSMRPLSWRLTMVRPGAGRCAGWGSVSRAPSATGAPKPLPHPFEARLSQTTRLLLSGWRCHQKAGPRSAEDRAGSSGQPAPVHPHRGPALRQGLGLGAPGQPHVRRRVPLVRGVQLSHCVYVTQQSAYGAMGVSWAGLCSWSPGVTA